MSDFSLNIVNQQFRKIFEQLESEKIIKGKSDIAQQLGTYNHVINSILKGKRNITVDQLNKLFEVYNVNANYMFGCSEQMFGMMDSDLATHDIEALVANGRNNITLVPNKALAGYALKMDDTDYLSSLQNFAVPGLEGQLIAFEISGDSMMPTITNGDLVVCEPVERGEPLKDNSVYVIVTDVVVAKRIQQVRKRNKVSEFRLISDNGMMYKPYNIDVAEIKQILKVKCRLTNYGIN